MSNLLKFPGGFLWGTSTSAHQVEGNNHNQWSEWEHANSARLAAEAARRHAKTPTRIPDYILNNYPNPLQEENYISGRACDHYNCFREDFDIAKSLGHNAHRFSIEWSRIEPEEGRFDEKEIEHYRQVILALTAQRIEPFVTLWHWTNPVWFSKKGGFEKQENIKYFVRFCDRIVSELKSEVKFWIILNEPEIYTGCSYFKGTWPPQKKCLFFYLIVLRNFVKAHRKVFEIIKKNQPNAQIGIAKNNIYFEAYQNKVVNVLLKKITDWWWNFYFLNRIKNHQDFIGLNYYFHYRIKGLKFNQNKNEKTSDLGREIYPKGIFHVLKSLKRYRKPIYITENGLADAEDKYRAKFIIDHLKWVYKAISEGIDVRGYFYWSLLDNFEWDKGFWPRFGLVEIDYKTMERKIKNSALAYAEICKNNELIT